MCFSYPNLLSRRFETKSFRGCEPSRPDVEVTSQDWFLVPRRRRVHPPTESLASNWSLFSPPTSPSLAIREASQNRSPGTIRRIWNPYWFWKLYSGTWGYHCSRKVCLFITMQGLLTAISFSSHKAQTSRSAHVQGYYERHLDQRAVRSYSLG